MRLAVACAAVLAAGCYTNAFSNAARVEKLQRRELARAMPARLAVAKPVPGTARTARVRVWVDADFRSQNVRWRAQIENQLDEVNQFLAPAVGIRLEAKDIAAWEARSADQPLAAVLTALEAHDRGDDVDWVIGYGSALTLVQGSFDELGMARSLGRHLVVRGYADGAERQAFAAAFPDTSDEERERVHDARRRHKEAVTLVHELAHTLGAPHETDPTWLLAASYTPEMATLSEASRALMQLTLETWLVPRGSFDLRAVATRLLGYFDDNPWGGWDDNAKGDVLAELRTITAAGGGGGSELTGAAREQFVRARRLAASGQLAEALAELDALTAAFPATFEVREGICEIQLAAVGPTAVALRACERASEVAPDNPTPYLAIAAAQFGQGDRAAALAALAKAEGLAGERAEVWLTLAQLYQAQTLVTLTERAAAVAERAQAGAAADLLAWARRTRGRYGLPPGGVPGAIALTDEGDYVTAVRALLSAINGDQFTDAARMVKAIEQRGWKDAPGLLAARCDLALRKRDAAGARKLCDQAIAAWSGAAWALYLRGVLLVQGGKTTAAIESLRAAIAAEPELAQAYRTLAKALDRAGDADGRAALAAEYQARFNARLP